MCDLHDWPTIGGKKYFVIFVDDCIRFCYVYLILSKDEVLDNFKIFKAQVKLQHETFIKCFRSDKALRQIREKRAFFWPITAL